MAAERRMTDESPAPAGKKAAPRRQRRKEARPAEIIEAALALFCERGFGATRMEDVARRAGVAKGTLFVYFPTKHDLFRAVAQTVVASGLAAIEQAPDSLDRPLATLIPLLLAQAAHVGQTGVPALARLLISESRAFPDLPRVWHDEVVSKVLGLVTTAIENAQARGEVRAGDARLYAFSIIGPMMSAMLFRDLFAAAGGALPDLDALATQHAATVLNGLLERGGTSKA